MEERYIAAIDLGTYKFALTVARAEGNDVQIIYYKEIPSDGVVYSYIANPAKVKRALMGVVADAENELKIKILQVVVGMPRYEVQVETATARIDRDSDTNIRQEEVDDIKSSAIDSYPLNDEKKEILYGAVAQNFSTEEEFQQIESDVVGMCSDFLEGNFKVFIGRKRPVGNINMVMKDLDITIARKYFIPDVTAKAVLSNEEMENGVALIDFGAGVTSVSVYKHKIMRHFASIPFGGKSITGDIRSESSISEDLAENLKLAYGALQPNRLQNLSEKVIQINDENDVPIKQIPVKYLSEIMTERTTEIIEAILYEILQSGFADSLRAGVVITGGCANMVNLSSLFKDLSGYTVRIGYPRHLFTSQGCSGVNETSATTSIGMVLAAKNERINCTTAPEPVEEPVFIDESAYQSSQEEENPVQQIVETVQTPVEEEPLQTGFMAAEIKDDEESSSSYTRSTSDDYDTYEDFCLDGPNPYPHQNQSIGDVERGTLFTEEQMPQKQKKGKTKTKKERGGNSIIRWIKQKTATFEEKMGTLYDEIQDDSKIV